MTLIANGNTLTATAAYDGLFEGALLVSSPP